MKVFNPEDLAHYNGKDGKPAYVAHEGNVYDVSESKFWKGGMHMRRHRAGTDLTVDIQASPHDSDLLARYPQVGILKKIDAPEVKLPGLVALLLETNPFFRRHPHPMTVHFPIVFFLSNPVFNMLYLLTKEPSFETTAFHCLVGGILFSVAAIVTGVITWLYNYMAKMTRAIVVKIVLSIALMGNALVLFFWRLIDPAVVTSPEGANSLYLVLCLSFVPVIIVIGWFGATMTFPIEKK